MEPEAATPEWEDQYGLSPPQLTLLRSVFERKMAQPKTPLMLDERDVAILVSAGADGIAYSRELLAAIGIVVP
jgi:hypothetical protein